MTVKFSAGDAPHVDAPPVDVLALTEKLLMQAAEALVRTIDKIEAGGFGEIKAAIEAVKDLKSAFQTSLDERVRVEKLRKHVTGTIGADALDLHAARDEIGRRLACLRDAGAG